MVQYSFVGIVANLFTILICISRFCCRFVVAVFLAVVAIASAGKINSQQHWPSMINNKHSESHEVHTTSAEIQPIHSRTDYNRLPPHMEMENQVHRVNSWKITEINRY